MPKFLRYHLASALSYSAALVKSNGVNGREFATFDFIVLPRFHK